MSYTPTTWNTGDTITASALNKIENGIANAGGASWDAVIRITHADNSGQDIPANLTPSIVTGSFAQLANKISNGGVPCILVEYLHPWGTQFAMPMAYITYAVPEGIDIMIRGASMVQNWAVTTFGTLHWSPSDALAWN